MSRHGGRRGSAVQADKPALLDAVKFAAAEVNGSPTATSQEPGAGLPSPMARLFWAAVMIWVAAFVFLFFCEAIFSVFRY